MTKRPKWECDSEPVRYAMGMLRNYVGNDQCVLRLNEALSYLCRVIEIDPGDDTAKETRLQHLREFYNQIACAGQYAEELLNPLN